MFEELARTYLEPLPRFGVLTPNLQRTLWQYKLLTELIPGVIDIIFII